MTVTVEHVATEHSGMGTTPRYRCHCGQLFPAAGAAHGCRHRLRPVTGTSRQDCPEEYDRQHVPGEAHQSAMPDRHEPALSLFDQEDNT